MTSPISVIIFLCHVTPFLISNVGILRVVGIGSYTYSSTSEFSYKFIEFMSLLPSNKFAIIILCFLSWHDIFFINLNYRISWRRRNMVRRWRKERRCRSFFPNKQPN